MSKIKYVLEDAIQIYHAKSASTAVFETLVDDDAWTEILPHTQIPTEDYFSDDEIIDFDLLNKEDYLAKIGNIVGKTDVDFPVLVIVRKKR